ncbi:MAG: VTT domain-containing protein, partial [Pseudomonadota bacterium]
QFGLHAASILIFGPVVGTFYAWIASLTGAAVHFMLGKRFGAKFLERYGGQRSQWISKKLAKHGILASAAIRLIPSGPFIVVNTLAGVSHMPFWKFLLGTAIGTPPKIIAIALVGGGLVDLIRSQDPFSIALIVAGITLWLVIGWFVKSRFFASEERIADDEKGQLSNERS